MIGTDLNNLHRVENTLYFSITAYYDEYEESFDYEATLDNKNEITGIFHEGILLRPFDYQEHFEEAKHAALTFYMELEEFAKTGKLFD